MKIQNKETRFASYSVCTKDDNSEINVKDLAEYLTCLISLGYITGNEELLLDEIDVNAIQFNISTMPNIVSLTTYYEDKSNS